MGQGHDTNVEHSQQQPDKWYKNPTSKFTFCNSIFALFCFCVQSINWIIFIQARVEIQVKALLICVSQCLFFPRRLQFLTWQDFKNSSEVIYLLFKIGRTRSNFDSKVYTNFCKNLNNLTYLLLDQFKTFEVSGGKFKLTNQKWLRVTARCLCTAVAPSVEYFWI